MKQHDTYSRYQRQMLLPNIGERGQQKLLQASVLVIGAGGLGCPALQYLAAAGVGTIGIVDDDVVSLSNLHRQVLYKTSDVGKSKVQCAATYLNELNPDVRIHTYNVRLTAQNALGILKSYDIVIDGTDNFASRYMINDACILLDKPLVYAGISTFEGQLAVFGCADKKGIKTNYRDLFPQPPREDEVAGCNEAGVLGVLPGIIGTMQAGEAIKLIAGIGQPLVNQLLTYSAATNSSYIINLTPATDNGAPTDEAAFLQTDYPLLCTATGVAEIDAAQLEHLYHEQKAVIIDVREQGEQPELTGFKHFQIPMSQLIAQAGRFKEDTIILICQTGKRSGQAAALLQQVVGPSAKIYSVKGGILNLKNGVEKLM